MSVPSEAADKGASPYFSVILVNYNGLHLLEECLASLEAQTFRDFEVILVDNASRDGSVEFVRERFPNVKLIVSPENLGFGGGNNLAYPSCAGRFIYFLNNDTSADPAALEELARATRENPDVRVFASFIIQYGDRTRADSAGDTLYTCGKGFNFSGYPVSMFHEERFITSACGGAALFSRAVLDKIGLFDADYFLNYEDLDLSFRAQHAGEKILFVPSSRIYHKTSSTQGGTISPLRLFYAERNFGLFVLKNFPLPALIRFIPAFLFVKAWGFLKLIWAGHPWVFVRGNLAFLRLLPGIPAKRRAILKASKLSSREFHGLLRKNWLREKIAFLRGDYNIPL